MIIEILIIIATDTNYRIRSLRCMHRRSDYTEHPNNHQYISFVSLLPSTGEDRSSWSEGARGKT
jgi:hypothetical protein